MQYFNNTQGFHETSDDCLAGGMRERQNQRIASFVKEMEHGAHLGSHFSAEYKKIGFVCSGQNDKLYQESRLTLGGEVRIYYDPNIKSWCRKDTKNRSPH